MEAQGLFKAFSIEHCVIIGIMLVLSFALVLMARSDKLKIYVKPISWVLAFFAVGHELVWIIGVIVLGQWHYSWGIPLQLCDLAVFAVAYVLIRHKQWVWELAYFWGLGGSLQAVLTPDLTVTFPDIVFIKFFLSHGLIVIGVIFLAVGLQRAITFKSVIRVFMITNIYGVCVLLFNWVAGTNYMYLMSKPAKASLLDYAGNGGFYYVGLEVLLMFSLLFYYLPYYFLGLVNRGQISLKN